MTDTYFNEFLYLLVAKNGGTLTINKFDILNHYPRTGDRLIIEEDMDGYNTIIRISKSEEKK